MGKINIYKLLSSYDLLFWIITIFAYFFQCYIRSLSVLIVPGLFLYILSNFRYFKICSERWLKTYSLFSLIMFMSFLHSFFILGHDLERILRFFFLLMVIPIAQNIYKNEFKYEWVVFKIISICKVASLIYIWAVVFIYQDYTEFRLWARMTEAGDIYIINWIPRVQLHGNCLILVGFILDYLKEKKITIYNTLMLVGVLVAGNSSFILGIVVLLFLLYCPIFLRYLKKGNIKAIPMLVVFCVFFGAFILYSLDMLNIKAMDSNATRIDQFWVLCNTNPLIGNGLGYAVYASTATRLYRGDLYYELQALYIYNQVGLIAFLLICYLTINPYNKQLIKQIAYLSYAVAAFFNPYWFDSTHIIALILITNLFKNDMIMECKK